MGRTHLVIPDPHARPGNDNERASWLGELINDTKPDVVVCLGDLADMPSLCSYDRGKKSYQGRTYKADVDAAIDFNDRLWSTVKRSKKKLPYRIILEGNHEERIRRAIELQAELEGVISFDDLKYNDYYDRVIRYEGSTPSSTIVDGVQYAHYLVSGVSGRPIYGEHTGFSLLSKQYNSCVVGHNHTLDYCMRSKANGEKIIGISAGCYFDYFSEFAGTANNIYWRGVVILKDVENGQFDIETMELGKIRKAYK